MKLFNLIQKDNSKIKKENNQDKKLEINKQTHKLYSILTKSIIKKFIPQVDNSPLISPSLKSKISNETANSAEESQTEKNEPALIIENFAPLEIKANKLQTQASKINFSRTPLRNNNPKSFKKSYSQNEKSLEYKIKEIPSQNSMFAYPSQYSLTSFKNYQSPSSFNCNLANLIHFLDQNYKTEIK